LKRVRSAKKFGPFEAHCKVYCRTPQSKKAETDELRLSGSDKTVALIAKSGNGEKIVLFFAFFTLHSL
jgi:hypothetical protein